MQWWITNQLAYKNNLYSINKNKEYEINTLLRLWLRGGVWKDDSENWSQTIWKHKLYTILSIFKCFGVLQGLVTLDARLREKGEDGVDNLCDGIGVAICNEVDFKIGKLSSSSIVVWDDNLLFRLIIGVAIWSLADFSRIGLLALFVNRTSYWILFNWFIRLINCTI